MFDSVHGALRLREEVLACFHFQADIAGDRLLSIRQGDALPYILPVYPKLLVGSGLAFSGTQVVYDLLKAFFYGLAAFAGVVQYNWQMVQKICQCLKTNVCAGIITVVHPLVRVCPDRRCQQQCKGLSALRLSPEVYHERQASDDADQHTCKRCCHHKLDLKTPLLSQVQDTLVPLLPASMALYALIDLAEPGRTVKFDPGIIRQEFPPDPSHF